MQFQRTFRIVRQRLSSDLRRTVSNAVGWERMVTIVLWIGAFCSAHGQTPWFFAVISDPQMGMYAKDQNSDQEIANFRFAIANLNRLHPRFVVICGDLVNRSGDPRETKEFKEIEKTLDPSIQVFRVAGNHDVGNVPDSRSLEVYRNAMGADYYTFQQGGLFGIVLNSNLIRSPDGDPEEARKQEEWLDRQLKAAQTEQAQRIIVFQHIPYFVHDAEEADQYFNIPQPMRRKFLEKLEKSGVQYVFAGHTHKSEISSDEKLTEITTGATGMPLGGSQSGIRLVMVDGLKLTSTWYCFGEIPNKVAEAVLPPSTCAHE